MAGVGKADQPGGVVEALFQRGEQREIAGWASKFRARKRAEKAEKAPGKSSAGAKATQGTKTKEKL